MKKVKPGDPLRITAKAWNEFVDPAEFVKSLRFRLRRRLSDLSFLTPLSGLPSRQPEAGRKNS